MTGPPVIRIGTSGWHYKHWVGPFYPVGLRPTGFLAHYARHFATAEINSTFYHLPKVETLAAWRETTPEDFVFACKASRYITHMKKLREPRESSERFFAAIEALGRKLGPILFQLPPRWRVNPERLAAYLEALPSGHRVAFEFRDPSWLVPAVYEHLARRNAALCIYDLAGSLSPLEVTADFVYLRLHGPACAYQGHYDDKALAAWAERLLIWRRQGLDAYCYFDNDEKGYAAIDAQRLLDMLEGEQGTGVETSDIEG